MDEQTTGERLITAAEEALALLPTTINTALLDDNNFLRAENDVLIEALKAILGWRELRNGMEFPVERVEEIARKALLEARALKADVEEQIIIEMSSALATSVQEDETCSMSQAARAMGKKGGKARASKLTAEQRREIAKNAATSRWKKEKQ